MAGRIAVLSLLAAAALAQPFATNSDERLAGYIEEALNRHPAIHESLAAYRSSLQRIPQVTALTEQDRGLLGHFEKLAQARYAQGVGLWQAVVKPRAEITRDATRLQSLRRLAIELRQASRSAKEWESRT